MKTTPISARILSVILALIVFCACLPIAAIAATPTDNRVVDLSTMDDWKQFFGNNTLSTANAGAVWTDKSVFTNASEFNNLSIFGDDSASASIQMDEANNFLVALSALASNKSITGYSHIPTDTMLVLDLSGSMGPGSGNNDAVDELVAAANSAIRKLQAVNNYNRVGIVLYSGNTDSDEAATPSSATVLFPLGRYSHSNNEFLVRGSDDGTQTVRINSNVKDQNNKTLSRTSKKVSGGTYIQNGIYQAMEELLAVEDTVISGSGFQSGTKRMPIMVLMSDGAPTIATDKFAGVIGNNGTVGFGNSNIGNGTSSTDVIGFVTQLTAAYAKARIEEHYDNSGLFYSLGLGVNSNEIARSVLDPKNSTRTINNYWNSYLELENGENLHLQGNGNNSRSAAYNSYVTNQFYIDEYFSATSTSQLESVFDTIVQQIIIQSLYYPTLISENNNHLDGYIEFIDDIGDYMEVKSIKGIALGDTLYTGAKLARNFTTGGGELGTVENPNDLGNNMIWAVMQRLGIDKLPQFDTREKQVAEARDLVSMAYSHGQLSYKSDTEYSNYIGWYSDAKGNYLGFWHESHTDEQRPAGAVYYNKSYGMLGEVKDGHRESDMMYISIQIHTNIATGHSSVIWKIPASLIPVVSYNITLEGDSIDTAVPGSIFVEIDETNPIRLLFEVGVRSDIKPWNIAEKLGANHRNADGTYTLYTNSWDINQFKDDAIPASEAINALSFFEPSKENEKFYFNEDTPVYQLNGSGYELYKGDTKPSGDNFYREFNIFEILNSATGAAEIVAEHEVLSANALSRAYKGADGVWYIPKGTPHYMWKDYQAYKLDSLGNKANPTDTLEYAAYPLTENHIDPDLSDGDDSYSYSDVILGNNGKITVTPSTGIIISKAVDETVTDIAAEFEFTVEAHQAVSSADIVRYDANGKETTDTVTFNANKATVKLKANEKVYILGLPQGSYTVTENLGSDYKIKSIDSVVTNNPSKVINVSEYALTPISFENTLNITGSVIITKTVEHPFDANFVIPNNIDFDFDVNFGSAYADTTVYDSMGNPYTADSNGIIRVTLKSNASIIFTGISEGTVVEATEVDIPSGFTPNAATVNGIVSSTQNTVLGFVNRYAPAAVNPVNITVEGSKKLEGRAWLGTDKFEFVLEKYDRTTADWVKVGSSKEATASKKDFDFNSIIQAESFAEIGTYHYRITEVYDSAAAIPGVSYDTNARYFNILVSDEDMNGRLEIEDVTAINLATVTLRNNEWAVETEFTNVYAPSGSASVIINVKKDIDSPTGAEISKEGFEFGVYAEDTLIGETVKTNINGEATLKLAFTPFDCGETFSYSVKEVKGEIKGMTYTDKVYDIEVYVYDKLDGTIGAYIFTENTDNSVPSDATNSYLAEFTNTYRPEDAKVSLDATKELSGRDLTDGEFSFEIYETDSSFQNEQLLETVKNSADGSVDFKEFTYDEIGTYYYIVKEVKGTDENITYDETVYYVTVEVKDGDEGKLIANVSYKADEEDSQAIVFKNIYTEPTPPTPPTPPVEPPVQAPPTDNSNTSPKTDDVFSNFGALIALMFVSGAVLVSGAYFLMKKKKEDN